MTAARRSERLEQLSFWDAAAVRGARAIVVGAGALGNEVIKNLLLLGWGRVLVIDYDRVERSNLSRSALFREDDVGAEKAFAAERAAASLNPESAVVPLHGDVRAVLSLGMVERADVILGCVDNVSARLAMSALAGRSGRPFIDGGLTPWEGTVSVFASTDGPCYGCGLTAEDLRDVGLRRSCPAYAARARAAGGVPTTPTVASITAALMVQTCLKWIHGMRGAAELPAGRQLRVDTRYNRFWQIGLPRSATCAFHPSPSEPVTRIDGYTERWSRILASCRELARDPSASIHLPFTISVSRTCLACSRREEEPALHTPDHIGTCAGCGGELISTLATQVGDDEPWHEMTPASMGCPPWSRISVCCGDLREIEVEITGMPARMRAFFERS